MHTRLPLPKYEESPNGLRNVTTLEPIPEDEPLFILRAKDVNALLILTYYQSIVSKEMRQNLYPLVTAFSNYAQSNPDKMKAPD
jgi:hypothetical protein